MGRRRTKPEECRRAATVGQLRAMLPLAHRRSCERAGQAYLEEFREDDNRRLAKPPRNSYDAHRPVREVENLDEILTLQKERRVSQQLTLNYNRTLYVVEDNEQNRRLRGHRVTVHQDEHGGIAIRHAGRELPYRAHPKDQARIAQGAIVENKRLGDALRWIAEQQRERDTRRLANPKITLRAKKRIRAEAAALA